VPRTTPRAEAEATKPWTPKDAPRFVRCELEPAQKEALAEWITKALDAELLEWLSLSVALGLTISVRANDVGYQCSLTGVRESGPHYGQSLVARASTPIKSLQACWYKDTVVLKSIWPVSKGYDDLDI
jgi:hypothetical protein